MSDDLISRKEALDMLRGNVLVDVTTEIEKTLEDVPVAFDKEKVIEELDDYLFEKYCVEGDEKIAEIVEKGGIE